MLSETKKFTWNSKVSFINIKVQRCFPYIDIEARYDDFHRNTESVINYDDTQFNFFSFNNFVSRELR